MNIRKVLGVTYTVAFGVSLVAALAVSTWSLHHLGHTYFQLPELLSWVVSGIFDVGALGAAILATMYALDGESAGKGKMAAYAMIGLSAWLNAEHAMMMGNGKIAAVLFAAPSIAAGILLDLFLDWLKSGSLRERGRTLKEFPLIRHATALYNPKKYIGFFRKGLAIDLKIAEAQLENRLTEIVPEVIKAKPIKATTTRVDKVKKPAVTSKKRQPKAIEAAAAPSPAAHVQNPDSGAIAGFSTFKGLPKNTSHVKLVAAALSSGIDDRELIGQAIANYTGKAPAKSTLNAYVARWKKTHATTKPLDTGMYL